MSNDETLCLLAKVKLICCENSSCEELEFAKNESDLLTEPIGDGNLNDVIRIKSAKDRTKSIIAKRGPPYIKCLGPEFPLTIQRTRVEYDALVKFNSLVPGSVPKPVCWVGEENLFFMEDLLNYKVLRSLLIDGVDCGQTILKLAKDIAIVHRETHVSNVSKEDFANLNVQFKNDGMVDLTRNYVFTAPFVKDDNTNRCTENVKPKLTQIYDDQNVLQTAERMRKIFLERKESLIHGDLHTGSVMCTAEGKDSKMIDIEFAYVGPCAFDVGMFLANLIFSYYQHMLTEQNNDVHRQYCYRIIDICKRFVSVYLEHMTAVSGELERFMSEVAGFCGCEIIRRIVGAAHVEDFDNSDFGEQDAIGAGIRLLQAVDRIHTIDRLMVIALMLA